MKRILITGANFTNKGAQSMLFVTVDEIRKRFNDVQIFFQTWENLDLDNYRFEKVNLSPAALCVSLGGWTAVRIFFIKIVKKIVKFFLKRPDTFFRELRDVNRVKNVDLIIDISGFGVGDKWSISENYVYINQIRFAKKYDIPIYIMPQSIGPFSGFDTKIRQELHDVFLWPKMIFPREKDGVKSLKDIGIVENVVLMPDIVLQNQNIDLKNIFFKLPELKTPSIFTEGNVALVPNRQCVAHGDEKSVLNIYLAIIRHLIYIGKNVYIIRHSSDDNEICESIYSAFHEKSELLIETESRNMEMRKADVYLINQDLSCLEYDSLIRNFSFVVGSRFHGLVHALRNNIPCIALGWAVKYKELLETVGLDEYIFDITAENIHEKKIINAIDKINQNIDMYKEIITNKLKNIRNQNCFGFLNDLV